MAAQRHNTPAPFKRKQHDVGLQHGWRSGLEEVICEALSKQRVPYKYEALRISYIPSKVKHYTPDILLLDNSILVELKGRFVTADRQKHLEIKTQHPDLDIRFVFSNSRSRISKTSQTTYALWCQSKGFQYADKRIPDAWLQEQPNARTEAAIRRLLESQKK